MRFCVAAKGLSALTPMPKLAKRAAQPQANDDPSHIQSPDVATLDRRIDPALIPGGTAALMLVPGT